MHFFHHSFHHFSTKSPESRGATAEILSKINAGLKHKLNPNKIGNIMKSLGIEKVRSKNGGRGYWVYEYTFDEIKANKLCLSAPEQAKLEL